MSVLDVPERLAPPSSEPLGVAGEVVLVGAGPGDPELLTLKAVRALERAQVVLYDHLVGPGVLAHVPAAAERICVGKAASHHTLEQEAIIELLIRQARTGRRIVRLKGGDGYIFGRGGEEALALARAGIRFTVVPGITAAQGIAASAGIPLTHRDHACTLVLATGHRRDDEPGLDWAALARPNQTVVVYMGVGALPAICAGLAAHGLPADTPAAVVEHGTLPDERRIVGTISSLPRLAAAAQVRSPGLIIIGSVVSLQPLIASAQVPAQPTARSR